MSMSRLLTTAIASLLILGASGVRAASPMLGQPMTESDVATWDISIGPGGTGLPAGSGTPAQGATVYASKCLACHGEKGSGGAGGRLAGGGPLVGPRDPIITVGNYWQYATTLFDFTRRTMPWTEPKSLTGDEVYAVTAYVLQINGIIGENDVMTAETLPKVRMPNRDGFIVMYPTKK
jgi:S-disulfanyl-L-cysteine oxidoreductase SoxD